MSSVIHDVAPSIHYVEFVTRFEGLRSRAWMRRKGVDTPLARCKVQRRRHHPLKTTPIQQD